MNRRPWPIVWMAVLQFLSPLFYVVFAAFFYHLSPLATLKEMLALTPTIRILEIFTLPILLGILILFTRKLGYYFVIAGSIYLMARGVLEFYASNETDPVFPIVITNFLCLVVVATLLREKTRSVYFNPRLRWWETSPRYIVSLPSSITRIGAQPMKATLQNIAAGGAGLETLEAGFLKNEIVSLEFQSEGLSLKMKSKIVWDKSLGGGKQYLGLQWADDNSSEEWAKLRQLIKGLKAKKTETTRHLESHIGSVKEWFSKLAG